MSDPAIPRPALEAPRIHRHDVSAMGMAMVVVLWEEVQRHGALDRGRQDTPADRADAERLLRDLHEVFRGEPSECGGTLPLYVRVRRTFERGPVAPASMWWSPLYELTKALGLLARTRVH